MTTIVLNKHGEFMSILYKYVASSSMYKLNSVGKRGYLCLTNIKLYFTMCVAIYSNFCIDCGVQRFCDWGGTPNHWRHSQRLLRGIVSNVFLKSKKQE